MWHMCVCLHVREYVCDQNQNFNNMVLSRGELAMHKYIG